VQIASCTKNRLNRRHFGEAFRLPWILPTGLRERKEGAPSLPRIKYYITNEVALGKMEGASFSPPSFIAPPGRSDCSTLGRLTMGRK
jgi:hypothetical protein